MAPQAEVWVFESQPRQTITNQSTPPPPKKLSITDYLKNNVSIFLSYEKKRTSKVRSGQMLKLQNVRG